MGENIHEPGDKPNYHSAPARSRGGEAAKPERDERKNSLGKAAFLIFCLAATALVISFATK